MLWHAIAPSRRYTKASHDVVRHPRLSSDAKILLLYVQGLPEGQAGKALSEHAKKLGITGRAYQRAKRELIAGGYVHEWKRQGECGFWVTDQLFANVPLTDDEARAVRESWVGPVVDRPGTRYPAVGEPRGRAVGGCEPVDEELGKNYSHPPTEEPEASEGGEAPGEPGPVEVGEGERVLLSLRHANPQLHLGVREARGLADVAAEWIRRGVSAADLRRVLTSELPKDGVRSAVGFLRHRLVQKLPAPVAAPVPSVAPSPVREFVVCEGEGEEHVFRPVADEALCGPCAREENRAYWAARRVEVENGPDPLPWRERVAAINGGERARGQWCGAEGGPFAGIAATRASGGVRDGATGA
ncbi:hypothetical protein [Streptomyces sp. NBC_00893]|uniref:hypothetical protein n=1 Tax=Streptomyces sp. NBC_00893 TaxID=2975862 RepID=UPI002253F5D1|nr:hypothetical protein [Streptomyces sp. NBC_00893]MCX4846886.1 hypothetical protein [Streptomyces sp. NBC_00893]